jgi:hypothetical protein
MGLKPQERRHAPSRCLRLGTPQWVLLVLAILLGCISQHPVNAQLVSVAPQQPSILSVSTKEASQSILVTLIDSSGIQPSDLLVVRWDATTGGSGSGSVQLAAEELVKGASVDGLSPATNYAVQVLGQY